MRGSREGVSQANTNNRDVDDARDRCRAYRGAGEADGSRVGVVGGEGGEGEGGEEAEG